MNVGTSPGMIGREAQAADRLVSADSCQKLDRALELTDTRLQVLHVVALLVAGCWNVCPLGTPICALHPSHWIVNH